MRKKIVLLLASIFVFSLVGCGQAKTTDNSTSENDTKNTLEDTSTINDTTTDHSTTDDSAANTTNLEDSIKTSTNVFESNDSWQKYLNGEYSHGTYSFEGEIMANGIGSGTLDGSGTDVYQVYSVSFKSSDTGYYVCTIQTTKTFYKGDKVKGWGIISGEKMLGQPAITVIQIEKI